MVYCFCYGVNNTKAEIHFLVLPEATSSNAGSYTLCHCNIDTVKGDGAAILTDLPFKITMLISKRILIEICTPLIYRIRSLYVDYVFYIFI
jgi:hypothetical protein